MIGVLLAFFVRNELKESDALRKVSISKNLAGEPMLTIQHGLNIYKDTNYHIRVLGNDAKVFQKNDLVNYEETVVGEMGDYVIELMFYDILPSDTLQEKYPAGRVHELKEVPMDMKSDFRICFRYPPADHMVAVYIGSDQPIAIDEGEYTMQGFPNAWEKHMLEM